MSNSRIFDLIHVIRMSGIVVVISLILELTGLDRNRNNRVPIHPPPPPSNQNIKMDGNILF